MIKNRKRKHCFDGWEHYNESMDKWMCGKQIVDKYNRVRGVRYVRAKKLMEIKNKKLWG